LTGIKIKKSSPYTDINNNGWIETALPAFVRPYAYLMRLDRPIGIWLLLLPGLWSIALASGGLSGIGSYELWIITLFTVGAVIMRGAGCIINDLWDRNLDRQVERTKARPLASGELSAFQASLFLAFLLLLGFVILLQMHITTILLGFMTIPLIVLYPLMKRITWWPQIFLGLTFNFGALMGWAAISGILSLAPVILYIGCIFWTVGYDTIYAHQDKEDDAKVGIKSTALKLGSASVKWVSLFYFISMILFLAAFMLAEAGMTSYILLALPSAHFLSQMRSWDMDDQASSLAVFKSNRIFGVVLLLAALL
jgi:4-hydroxybenzoate polyprenyltransferase